MGETKAAPTVGAAGAESVNQANSYESPTHTNILQQTGHEVKGYGATEQAILSLLSSGRDNALKRRELMSLTGLHDRVLRRGIEALRRAGVVICSDVSGYYLPGTLEEVQEFIRQEEARARSTFFTLQSARQLAEQMQQQGEQVRFSEVV